MKLRHISVLLAFLLVVSLFLTQQVYAQSDTVLVPWETTPGSVTAQVNALRDFIVNDLPRNLNRVYKLAWGGFYHNSDPIENEADYSLVIVGETFEESQDPLKEESWGPAIIQRVPNTAGTTPGQMFNASGNLTLINVWLMGQSSTGVRSAYEPIKLLGDGKRYIFDKVIFDRNDWHHLGPDAPNVDFFITNCKFRNLFGPTQQWEGIGIRFEVGADTVVIENNTFLNIGFTPFQSEAAPARYFRFNHNTLVNVGRSFSAGALWKTVYITNNIFINPFWHGEDESQYGDPARVDPYAGFFSIAAIDELNEGREILVTKNSYWRDPQFQTFYDNYSPVIRAQPFINDTTQNWFNAYPTNMKFMDNFIGVNPGVTTYPLDQVGIFDSMKAHISYFYGGGATNSPRYYFDPGRDENSYVNSIWPVGENFTYSNTTLQTAGTDELPLGDLNWYPTSKSTFEANKDVYVKAIEDIISAPVITTESVLEAEKTTLAGDATIKEFQGFTYVAFQGAGNVLWHFNMGSAATVSLVVYTRSNDARRGEHIRLNGTGLRNDAGGGEYNWYDLDPVIWKGYLITVDTLLADPPEIREAMNLEAGDNTLEIAPSWGYQSFYGINVLVGTDTLFRLRAPNAVQPVSAPIVAEGSAYVPSSFQEVTLGAGGSISFDVNVSETGEYMVRLFHANADASVQVEVDGGVVIPSLTLADTSSTVTDRFDLTAGQHTIKISSAAGGVNLDYVEFLSYKTTGVRERPDVPQGYALAQNYPNPFNPTTTINFDIGKPSTVKLIIYNLLGQRVATLLDSYMNGGAYAIPFDGSNLASGVYFYRLEAGDFKVNKKMMLLK